MGPNPQGAGREWQKYPNSSIFFHQMQKNSFFAPASSGFFHSNTQCNHLFTPGLWKTLWKLLKTPCPMRFSTFPRFHNALLLCKQTTEFFQIGTKNPFFWKFSRPQYREKSQSLSAVSCVNRILEKILLTICQQAFNIHFTRGPFRGGEPPLWKEKTMLFPDFVVY